MASSQPTRIAVDLGASSGRVIVGQIVAGRLLTHEVARFANAPTETRDATGRVRWSWDWAQLCADVTAGLHAAVAAHPEASTVGIDSWAVDYGLLDQDGQLIADPVCYRDERTTSGVERVHQRRSFDQLYRVNGLQFLPFTSYYQLAADDQLGAADTALLIPDLLTHHLTGSLATEQTNASTTGLLDPVTGQWNQALATALGLAQPFPPLVEAGQSRGRITLSGLDHLEVVTTASHDTAAAIAATPLIDGHSAYVSLGTWALAGLELDQPVLTEASRQANFTHEGGVASTVRFLRNVMGTWLLTETLREWGQLDDLSALLDAAALCQPATQLIDVDDATFIAPGPMATRISTWLADHRREPPSDRPGFVRLIVDSIAAAIADTLAEAARLAGVELERIHVVGGGAQNALLCQQISSRSGVAVIAGPVEATAWGNLLAQAGVADRAALQKLRTVVAASTTTVSYQPE